MECTSSVLYGVIYFYINNKLNYQYLISNDSFFIINCCRTFGFYSKCKYPLNCCGYYLKNVDNKICLSMVYAI